MNSKGWGVYEIMPLIGKKEIHVIPEGDKRKHREDLACWCVPSVEEYKNAVVITHNAADFREVVEFLVEDEDE